MSTKDDHLRFIYIRPDSIFNDAGAICFGYSTSPGADNTRVLKWSLSLCMPGDLFSRKIARSIISGRIDADKYVLSTKAFTKEPTYEEVIQNILSSMMNDSDLVSHILDLPLWVQDMLDGYLDTKPDGFLSDL